MYISIHPHWMWKPACFYVPVPVLDSLLDQRPFEDRWKGNNSILQMWLPHWSQWCFLSVPSGKISVFSSLFLKTRDKVSHQKPNPLAIKNITEEAWCSGACLESQHSVDKGRWISASMKPTWSTY